MILHSHKSVISQRGISKQTNLVAQFTYEAVGAGRRVADLPDFVGHVVTNFQIFRQEFESVAIDDVFFISLIDVRTQLGWLDRVDWVEEVRKRN